MSQIICSLCCRGPSHLLFDVLEAGLVYKQGYIFSLVLGFVFIFKDTVLVNKNVLISEKHAYSSVVSLF